MSLFNLREDIPLWLVLALAAACMLVGFGWWWYVTSGEFVEERIYSPLQLPSPVETFKALPRLWADAELAPNTWVSLRRVGIGFGLAALIGVPIGILCGCFPAVNAFFSPLTLLGRYAPMAAVIPLTFALFGSTSEKQKYMFIFLSSVAFVIADSARAVLDIGGEYIDTAFTLGASRRQVILKVLVPLAMPGIFNSLRLLFGLAFGYIMLAELVTIGDIGGLGHVLNQAQTRGGNPAFVILILLIIPIVALAIDRGLYYIQRHLFPYRYGGLGLLARVVQALLRGWEDLKLLFWTPAKIEIPAAPRTSDEADRRK